MSLMARAEELGRFVRRRIVGHKAPDRDPERTTRETLARGESAAALLRSDVFVFAYQDELDQIIDAVLAIDTTDEAQCAKALRLIARAQELQALVAKLNGYVNAGTLLNAQKEALTSRRHTDSSVVDRSGGLF